MAWTNCQFLDQLSILSSVCPFGPGHPRFLQIEIGMDGRTGPSDPLNIRRRISNIQQRPTSHNKQAAYSNNQQATTMNNNNDNDSIKQIAIRR